MVKNERRALPLAKPKILSMFGYDAVAPKVNNRRGPGLSYDLGYNSVSDFNEFELYLLHTGTTKSPSAALGGTLYGGAGSGSSTPSYINAPFMAIQQYAMLDGTFLYWDFERNDPTVHPGSDRCLVFINEFAQEGIDRESLADIESDQLVLNVAKQCHNTIVIIHNAGIRLVESWIDHPNVTAVIFAHLPGQESGEALVNILYGKVSPTGRLPYTIAKREEDYRHLLRPDEGANSTFSEGVNIDYRHFMANKIEPRFEFGFGLSYTRFEYSQLLVHVSKTPKAGSQKNIAYTPLRTVRFRVKNVGTFPTEEVCQVYIQFPDEDIRVLRAFKKIFIESGRTAIISLTLTTREFSRWNVATQKWELLRGAYKVHVGRSSAKIELSQSINFDYELNQGL